MLHKENTDYFINISSPVNVAMMGSNILKTGCGKTIINVLKKNTSNSFKRREEKRDRERESTSLIS